MRKRKSPLTGFTLIELLVVVVIIGILASVVALNVTNAPDRVYPTVVKHDFKRIADGIKMFKLDTHRYPEKLDELMFGADLEGWNGPYLMPSGIMRRNNLNADRLCPCAMPQRKRGSHLSN